MTRDWGLSLLSQTAETTHIQHALAGCIAEDGGRRALPGANLAQLRCLLEQRAVDVDAAQSESRCECPDSAAYDDCAHHLLAREEFSCYVTGSAGKESSSGLLTANREDNEPVIENIGGFGLRQAFKPTGHLLFW